MNEWIQAIIIAALCFVGVAMFAAFCILLAEVVNKYPIGVLSIVVLAAFIAIVFMAKDSIHKRREAERMQQFIENP